MPPGESLTYLVTGGAGFIGSHLCSALITQHHRVLAIDNISTGRVENIQHLLHEPNFHFVRASIQDEPVLDRLVSESDVIIHLAAAVGVKFIIENPVHTIETNVMGTHAVLKAALRYGTKVMLASTSEVYGKTNKVPFSEEDDIVLGPTSRSRWAYAASKIIDEFLMLAYARQSGLPVVIFRIFNTVGPRQLANYGMVIPRFVQQALRNEPITVHGDGHQSRCFTHVDDAVEAIISLSLLPKAVGQVFNIGNTEEVTILELAHKVLHMVDKVQRNPAPPLSSIEDRIVFVPYDEAYMHDFEDMQRRVPDNTKLYHHTGWQPQRSLEQILHDVIIQFLQETTE